MRWSPAVASHGWTNWTQVASEIGVLIVGGRPVRVVDLELDRRDAPIRRPRDAGNRNRARLDALRRRCGASIRDWVRIGPVLDQPSGTQYASNASQRRQLDLGQPLRRADVAIQAGNDEAGREAVVGGQRLAVHRHRHQRLAVVGNRVARSGSPTVKPSTAGRRSGSPPDRSAARSRSSLSADAAPQRIADEVAADLVADAGDRHVLLVERPSRAARRRSARTAASTMPVSRRRQRRCRAAARGARCRSGRTRRSARRAGVRSRHRLSDATRGQRRAARRRRKRSRLGHGVQAAAIEQ